MCVSPEDMTVEELKSAVANFKSAWAEELANEYDDYHEYAKSHLKQLKEQLKKRKKERKEGEAEPVPVPRHVNSTYDELDY